MSLIATSESVTGAALHARRVDLALCFFGRDQFLGRHTIPVHRVIPAWNPIFTFVFARRRGPGMTPCVPPPSKIESKIVFHAGITGTAGPLGE